MVQILYLLDCLSEEWNLLLLCKKNATNADLGTRANIWITSAQAIYELCIQLLFGSCSRCTEVRELNNIYITPHTSRSLLNQMVGYDQWIFFYLKKALLVFPTILSKKKNINQPPANASKISTIQNLFLFDILKSIQKDLANKNNKKFKRSKTIRYPNLTSDYFHMLPPTHQFASSTHVNHLTLGHMYGHSRTYFRPETCKIFKILPGPTLGHVSMLDNFSQVMVTY